MPSTASRSYYKDITVEVPDILQEGTIETTGAGDTFCGCMLHYVCENSLVNLSPDSLEKALSFANAAASLITTRKDALRVTPEKEEIL